MEASVRKSVVLKACGGLEKCVLDGCLPRSPLLISMQETEAVTQQQGRLVQVHVARRKLCEAQGCSTQPSFGFPGEQARRCKAHAQEGMVSIRTGKSLSQGGRSTPGAGEAHVLQPASARNV